MNYTSGVIKSEPEIVDYTRSKAKRKVDDRGSSIDSDAVGLSVPAELEEEFAIAIFEYGLKESSPKVLLSLMPQFPGLNTEHIKSHLQKYRIHHERSKEEFSEYYRDYLKGSFEAWISSRGWESSSSKSKVLMSGRGGISRTMNYTAENKRSKKTGQTAQDALQDAQEAVDHWDEMYSNVVGECNEFMTAMSRTQGETCDSVSISANDSNAE